MKYEGNISNIREVTRNRAQFQLDDKPELLELFISQSWVLNEGDHVITYGEKDKTGKVCCHAYKNTNLNVTGWKDSSIIDLFQMAFANVVFLLPLILILLMVNNLSYKWTFIWTTLFIANIYIFYKLFVTDYLELKKLSRTVANLP
jgi:hypothetical protein